MTSSKHAERELSAALGITAAPRKPAGAPKSSGNQELMTGLKEIASRLQQAITSAPKGTLLADTKVNLEDGEIVEFGTTDSEGTYNDNSVYMYAKSIGSGKYVISAEAGGYSSNLGLIDDEEDEEASMSAAEIISEISNGVDEYIQSASENEIEE